LTGCPACRIFAVRVIENLSGLYHYFRITFGGVRGERGEGREGNWMEAAGRTTGRAPAAS
jgi:hypothetical protein